MPRLAFRSAPAWEVPLKKMAESIVRSIKLEVTYDDFIQMSHILLYSSLIYRSKKPTMKMSRLT